MPVPQVPRTRCARRQPVGDAAAAIDPAGAQQRFGEGDQAGAAHAARRAAADDRELERVAIDVDARAVDGARSRRACRSGCRRPRRPGRRCTRRPARNLGRRARSRRSCRGRRRARGRRRRARTRPAPPRRRCRRRPSRPPREPCAPAPYRPASRGRRGRRREGERRGLRRHAPDPRRIDAVEEMDHGEVAGHDVGADAVGSRSRSASAPRPRLGDHGADRGAHRRGQLAEQSPLRRHDARDDVGARGICGLYAPASPTTTPSRRRTRRSCRVVVPMSRATPRSSSAHAVTIGSSAERPRRPRLQRRRPHVSGARPRGAAARPRPAAAA